MEGLKYKWILRDANGNLTAGWSSYQEVCALIDGLTADEQIDVLASPKG